MTEPVKDAKDVEKPATAATAPKPTEDHPARDRSSKSPVAAVLPRRMSGLRVDARTAAVATVALVAGTGFGMLAAPRGNGGDALARVEASLAAGRGDAARLDAEMEGLGRALSALREANETGRGETKAAVTGVAERLTRMEQSLDRRIAALTETVARAEREPAAPPPTPAQQEKRAATPVTVETGPAAAPLASAKAPRPEPTQTASIETRPKSETIETWALRDVYDGVAMLEDRKRRLVEVAPGDAVPGIGRVEAIERRGRNWVVVTRQGLITSQMW